MTSVDPTAKSRVVIVSNRLPISVTFRGGDFELKPSVGGLATGLSAYLESLGEHPSPQLDYVWVGWPGNTVSDEHKPAVRERCLAQFRSFPVFLSEQEIDQFYQGFCNKTIWPLFHYFPAFTTYNPSHWSHYLKVNETFCKTLVELIRPDDTLWIHDYHLMLLPQLVRRRLPALRIGFFLHIPFPNFEIFRLLPKAWRRRILEGLLGADVVGFHTTDYKQEFLRCVLRVLGHEAKMGSVTLGEHIVRAASFPMGIDFNKYHDRAASPDTRAETDELLKSIGGEKIVLSVDRLDYTKGIMNRLEGFETFLEVNPSWHGRVVLLLIVVPSRIGIEHYDSMKSQIEGAVGKINGRFGNVKWTPITYMFKGLTFSPLVAVYSACHVALLTPLRDGMNLIAKEYIASRVEKTGVLILSEMAGAAKELGEALIINPNNREEIADSLLEALEMPEQEQIRRNTALQARLKRYDVVTWANVFLDDVQKARDLNDKYSAKHLDPEEEEQLLASYGKSSRRLLLLDYDGTLVPFVARPEAAVPGPQLLGILRALSANRQNDVVIISGRDRQSLERFFSGLPVRLVAEHGSWFQDDQKKWRVAEKAASSWKPEVERIIERYVDRIPDTFLEEKDFSLAWHFRAANPETAEEAAQELIDNLILFTANVDVQVLRGNKVVEVRTAGVNKGSAGRRFLSSSAYDFVLAAGDDTTDEDLFVALPEWAYSIHVGGGGTRARHIVPDSTSLIRLIGRMA